MTKTEYLEKICADLGIDVATLPDRLIGTYLGAIKERLGMMNEGGTLSQHLAAITEPYNAGVADGVAQCQKEGHDAAYNAGRDAGYAEGYDAGVANAAPSAPTTPTDNRTALAHWYQYLAENFKYVLDWDVMDIFFEGQVFEELPYPTGTQNVTNVRHFSRVLILNEGAYNDPFSWSLYEEMSIPTKKFTGELNLPNCTDLSYMFLRSEHLEDVGTINFTNATNVYSMFRGDFPALKHVILNGIISGSDLDVKYAPALDRESLISILNALEDKTTDTSGTTWKITFGSTNMAKLTEEELDIAMSKGWQVK